MARYSGLADVVVGCSVLNRDLSETQELIGPLADLLPHRLNLAGRPTFRMLLCRSRRNAVEAKEYHTIPFGKLIDELQVERNLNHTPLFQVVLNFNHGPSGMGSVAGLELREFEFETGISKFDLSLNLFEQDTHIKTRLDFNIDLFSPETARRILENFEILLEAIVATPDCEIWELPLLTESERRTLLVEWTKTKADFPRELCFHQLFESQVIRTPQVFAVEHDGRQLTYDQLNRQANQLAHYLRKRGVGPDVVVGLCVHRSIEMLVAGPQASDQVRCGK